MKAFDSADLYARAPGYLTSVRVDIGSRVKKDEILAELFDPGLSAAVEKARAEVEKAQAQVAKAMAALDVAQAAADAQHLKSEYAESLAQRKGISPKEVPLYRAAEAEAKARVAMARAEIAEAESEVRISRAGLESTHAIAEATKIRSPYDGVVTRRGCHVGELVGSPSAGEGRPPLHGRPHGHHAGRGFRARP